MDLAIALLGDCKEFTWSFAKILKESTQILQGSRLEFCMDFAMVSLEDCKESTWSSAMILQGVHLDFGMVLLEDCKDFSWSFARIEQILSIHSLHKVPG